MENVKIERQCEKCAFSNPISLENDLMICARCGHLNKYDNEGMKLAMTEIEKKVKKVQFTNPQNN